MSRIAKYLIAVLLMSFFGIQDGFGHNVGSIRVQKESFHQRRSSSRAAISSNHVKDQLLVKLKKDVSVSTFSDSISISKLTLEKEALRKPRQKNLEDAINKVGFNRWHTLLLKEGADESQVVAELKKNPMVEAVQLSNYYELFDVTPNDTYFPNQWHFSKIEAPKAWETSTSSEGVLISVIDSGVDYLHPDLKKNIVKAMSVREDDSSPMDTFGHGTFVIGEIAAEGNNLIGVTGLNWLAEVLSIKVFDEKGNSDDVTVVNAIMVSLENGAKVINASWGGSEFSQILYDAVSVANETGCLFVAAAGNGDLFGNGLDIGTSPIYPASFNLPNVIAVSATDYQDNLASFANRSLKLVQVSAPGVNILSTVPTRSCILCQGASSYAIASGTSTSAPLVSAVCALYGAYLKKQGKPFDAQVIKQKLIACSDPKESLRFSIKSGGRLNAANLFENDLIPPSPIRDFTVIHTGFGYATVRWTNTGDDGISGTATRLDVRYSRSPIDESNYEKATSRIAPPFPTASGQLQITDIAFPGDNGIFYVRMKIFDNVGNASALSNEVVVQLENFNTLIFDDAEHGIENWTLKGMIGPNPWTLWHTTERKSYSPSKSFRYANKNGRNYDTSYANSGSIESVAPLNLTGFKKVELVFWHYLSKEDGLHRDTAMVQVSADNGITWIRVLNSNSTNGRWVRENVDLSDFLGKNIKVRFYFESDPTQNDFEGWYLDDIHIVGLPKS
ncbi:MAG: S8 family serine peptidase [Parcubacteria group bacterium]|nr:S8 family serine peptidase [Parcubacteria group bacterium]